MIGGARTRPGKYAARSADQHIDGQLGMECDHPIQVAGLCAVCGKEIDECVQL